MRVIDEDLELAFRRDGLEPSREPAEIAPG